MMIRKLYKIFLICLVTLLPSIIKAQAPKLVATISSATVQVGAAFQITYTLYNAGAESFTQPSFNNFNFLGRSQSSGGGMTVIVNGQVVQSGASEEKWTFQLSAPKVGKFEIGPAKARVGGKIIESNSLVIEVKQGAQQVTQGSAKEAENAGYQELYVRAIADKTNTFKGDQIIVTYKIYTRVPVSQYAIQKVPGFNGFWSQTLSKENEKPNQYEENINGQRYVVADIYKVIVFPQKTGKLIIEPLDLECVVQVKGKRSSDPFEDFFNDPFFRSPMFDTYQNQKRNIKSNSLSFDIKAIPGESEQSDFGGAVGNFSLKATIDRRELRANEAANLKVTVSGNGNLKLIEKPQIVFPSDFEVYDPKISENISTSSNGVSGTKTFEFLIIPRNPGDYVIKPFSFTFFDPSKKSFQILTSPEFSLKVSKGSGTSSNIAISGVNQEDIKYIGSDIRFIKTSGFNLRNADSMFFASWLYFVCLIFPAILFALFIVVMRKQIKERSNVKLMRNKKATKVALRRLKLAGTFLKAEKSTEFYNELANALWGYIHDKFSVQISDLSFDSAKQIMASKQISEAVINDYANILESCEYARFAPSAGGIEMKSLYQKALDVIVKTEKELKN